MKGVWKLNQDKKIVFFDLDGTLMDHNKMISESTKQSLTALRKKAYTLLFVWYSTPYVQAVVRRIII